MSLRDGIYAIRQVLDDGPSNNYATALELDSTITVLPLRDDSPSWVQKWEVCQVNGESNAYEIKKAPGQPGPEGGFAFEGLQTNRESPVMYSSKPTVWILQEKDATKPIYSILPKDQDGVVPGNTLAVDVTGRGNSRPFLAVQQFSHDFPGGLPGWQFEHTKH